MYTEDCPARRLKERYISVDDVPDRFGISVDKCMELIEARCIKYAEFKKPDSRVRTPFIDPVELEDYLSKHIDLVGGNHE